MSNALLIISITPVAGNEEAFEEWVVKNHLPEVASSRRFVSAGLYRATDVATLPGVPVGERSFFTVYELEAATAAECEDAAQGLREKLAAGETSFSPSILDPAQMTASWVLPVAVTR
jgi:hypothetical protein